MVGKMRISSKYVQMVKILETAIERGVFPEGSRITSENELSRKYGISRNTVREAISSLVQQGYLTRTQGKGTFVTGRRPSAMTADTFAIFIHAHGHICEPETRALVRNFQRQGAMPMVFAVEDFKENVEAEKSILNSVINQGVTGLVVEEDMLPLLAGLAKTSGKTLPMIAVVNHAHAPPIPVKAVITDLTFGTALGTRHLIELGRSRILFVIHRNIHMDPAIPPHTLPAMYGDICRGYADAMTAAGLADRIAYFYVDHEFEPGGDDRKRLQAVLAAPDRPDAVFAFGDYRAKHVIDIAAEIGLRVPEDLAVIGFWNTPWAEMTRVPLTTVSIREDEIARVAAEKLFQARQEKKCEPETVVVKPRLVVRVSCGALRSPS
jgi:GntR family transcriptional regulator, arabinose operon transcriptional repressor